MTTRTIRFLVNHVERSNDQFLFSNCCANRIENHDHLRETASIRLSFQWRSLSMFFFFWQPFTLLTNQTKMLRQWPFSIDLTNFHLSITKPKTNSFAVDDHWPNQSLDAARWPLTKLAIIGCCQLLLTKPNSRSDANKILTNWCCRWLLDQFTFHAISECWLPIQRTIHLLSTTKTNEMLRHWPISSISHSSHHFYGKFTSLADGCLDQFTLSMTIRPILFSFGI